MRLLFEGFEKYNKRHGLIQKNDRLVLGLSGGPDSVALLLFLLKLKNKYTLRICAAHLNHNLSSARSSGHEAFSEKLARRLSVPFYKKSVNVTLAALRHGQSLEEAGRAERYRFFTSVAKKTGSNKIVTAHTLDDQAETVLMRAARGCGLRGLSGIPVKRTEGAFQIIRPLIGVSKKDILAFLKKTGQLFYQDPSNFKDVYTRNRVRNHLIPWVEKNLNPQVKQGLSDLGEICAETQNLVDDLSERALKNCLKRKTKHEIRLDTARLGRLHPAVCSEVIYRAMGLLRGGRARFASPHITAVRDLLLSKAKNPQTHLPGSMIAVKKTGTLRIFDTSRK